MNAKEHFRLISRIEALIRTKKLRAEALRSLACDAGSVKFNRMPRNPSGSLSPMADAICKALDLESEILKDELRLKEMKVFLLELIGSIDNSDWQTVLIKRYFEHLSWEKIADHMFYSMRWIYKLHGGALEAMDSKLNENAHK